MNDEYERAMYGAMAVAMVLAVVLGGVMWLVQAGVIR